MRPWLFLVLVLISLRGWGQEVLWEYSYGWPSRDELTDVLALPDSDYVACGTSTVFGVRDTRNRPFSAVCVLKILPNGDTAWFKHLEFYGGAARLCQGDTEGFFMVATQLFTPPADETAGVFLFKIDYEGHVLWQRQIPNLGYTGVAKMLKTSKGDILLTGAAFSDSGTGNTYDMYVVRLNSMGLVYFLERYNDNPRTFGNWIEQMPSGHYLASGSAGSRIWAVEIDSNGVEVQRQTMYQNSSHIVYDDEAWVNQGPGGTFIATGFSSTSGYFGLYSGLSSSGKIWGGEQAAYFKFPYVNTDTSIVVFTSSATVSQRFAKYRSDSLQLWSIPFANRFGSVPVNLNAIAYNSDSSAVAVGSAEFTGAPKSDFYLCRIKNVGVPYDPTRPVATKPSYKGLPPLIAYPNPTSGPVTIHTRIRQPLAVYSLSGQKRAEVQADPSGTTVLDLAGLPKGMYLLRQGENSIKLIKD